MKKQDIFDTTLSLIVEQGLHATPMSQIARESGVAIGTIYHYFSSKEVLVQALYSTIHAELEEAMITEEVELNNYEAEFSSLCLRVFKYFIQNPLKFYFLQQYENSPFGFSTDELNANIELPIKAKLFELGLQHNLLKPSSLSLISNIVYANIVNLVRLHLSQKIELNKEMIQMVIDGCWHMVKK